MKRICIVALSAILGACSHLGSSSAPQDPSRIAFTQYIIVGDSLMDFSADGELTTTASLILLEENTSVTNISLSGQTMAGVRGNGGAERDGVSGAINYLTAHGNHLWVVRPGNAIIVELAHNDWMVGTPADDFYNSYVRFLKGIDRGNNAVKVFCMVPIAAKWDYDGHQNPNGMTYEDLRDVVRKVAGTGLCIPVETSGWFSREDVENPLIMPDGVHLAAGGHRIYKDRLMEEMSKYEVIVPGGSKNPGQTAPGSPAK